MWYVRRAEQPINRKYSKYIFMQNQLYSSKSPSEDTEVDCSFLQCSCTFKYKLDSLFHLAEICLTEI